MVNPNHHMLQRENNGYAIGACDSETQGIYINNTLYNSMLKKVLCHEIVHASIFSYNVILSYEEEEFIADLIATFGEEIINLTNSIFKSMKKRIK